MFKVKQQKQNKGGGEKSKIKLKSITKAIIPLQT